MIAGDPANRCPTDARFGTAMGIASVADDEYFHGRIFNRE
jgi:hypothetical protein